MRKFILLIVGFGLVFTTPSQFELGKIQRIESKRSLPSNGIIDFGIMDENTVFLGTGSGLGKVDISEDGSPSFSTVSSSLLPEGGNPALSVYGNAVAVAGVTEFYSSITETHEPKGTGIGYSTDGGYSWGYMDQPVMEVPDEGLYQEIDWGGDTLMVLAVTTDVNNVSYDLAVGEDYVYAASWAGGLRRFRYLDIEPQWEIVPLPMDDQDSLNCGMVDAITYELNPKDPQDGGSHNHKGFSVHLLNEEIWVGTANGINKGVKNADCINWTHYTTDNGLSGNWVIGINHQIIEYGTRLWAITWSTDQTESTGLSYSDDGGTSWIPIQFFTESSIKVYNVSFDGDRVFASTIQGLYISDDAEHWEKYPAIVDSDTGEMILDESVFDSFVLINTHDVWLGTGDGLGIYHADDSMDVYRFWVHTKDPSKGNLNFSAYPNPFYIRDHNVYGGYGHVRFVFFYNDYGDTDSGAIPVIDIYDFAMDHVTHLVNVHPAGDLSEWELIWDGRNDLGDLVANGVYFCKMSISGNAYWTKLVVVN